MPKKKVHCRNAALGGLAPSDYSKDIGCKERDPEGLFGYLLRLGIQVALLAIGGVLALGIYYSEGRILVDGWEWVQGMADAVTEFFC